MNYFTSNRLTLFTRKLGRCFCPSKIAVLVLAILMAATSLWAAEEVAPSLLQPLLLTPEPVQKDLGKWQRDPFKNPKDKSQSTAGKYMIDSINLQGIMMVESKGYALVNGKVFVAGNSIGEGVIIKEIGKFHIVVRNNDSLQTYNIFQGKLK